MPHGEQKLFFQKINALIDRTPSTPFEKSVWRAALSIPFGEVRSYGWIAVKIGKPGSARAVGNALSRNKYPIIIPCHRVIRKNGDIGGFGYGRKLKALLLDIEGVKCLNHQ